MQRKPRIGGLSVHGLGEILVRIEVHSNRRFGRGDMFLVETEIIARLEEHNNKCFTGALCS